MDLDGKGLDSRNVDQNILVDIDKRNCHHDLDIDLHGMDLDYMGLDFHNDYHNIQPGTRMYMFDHDWHIFLFYMD